MGPSLWTANPKYVQSFTILLPVKAVPKPGKNLIFQGKDWKIVGIGG